MTPHYLSPCARVQQQCRLLQVVCAKRGAALASRPGSGSPPSAYGVSDDVESEKTHSVGTTECVFCSAATGVEPEALDGSHFAKQ